ncbi:MAG: phosphatidylglycerol lysyltransferase domain-containing protein [Dysgonamonadaceae bacterium]|jgi:hypothetical protein|nr:phosphatidylglycerol lysyltransferase domain-containing protein [Dysgonamonadaceae bacterium]
MLCFSPVTIEDKPVIQPFFDNHSFRNCDFSFSNIFSWKHFYHTTFATEGGFLFIRFQVNGHLPGYLFPLGKGDLADALNRIRQDARKRGDDFRLYAITPEMFARIEEAMPGQFSYEKKREGYEYLYDSDKLISLSGKKYQSKRNHINKFTRTYEWEYLPITRAIIPDCLRLYRQWNAENSGRKSELSLTEERIATETAFAHYEQLGLAGGALRIDGDIRAYSYGQPLTADTFGIHAEKCLYDIDGGFAMINQQFAAHHCSAYRYINREEDLGLESLRQAKLSYHPSILLEKGWVQPKH